MRSGSAGLAERGAPGGLGTGDFRDASTRRPLLVRPGAAPSPCSKPRHPRCLRRNLMRHKKNKKDRRKDAGGRRGRGGPAGSPVALVAGPSPRWSGASPSGAKLRAQPPRSLACRPRGRSLTRGPGLACAPRPQPDSPSPGASGLLWFASAPGVGSESFLPPGDGSSPMWLCVSDPWFRGSERRTSCKILPLSKLHFVFSSLFLARNPRVQCVLW